MAGHPWRLDDGWGYPWVSPVSFGDYDKKKLLDLHPMCQQIRDSERAVGVCPKNELNKLSNVSQLYIWYIYIYDMYIYVCVLFHIRSICSRMF